MGDRQRVLVVEDEAVVQVHLRRLLEDIGYEVCGVAAAPDEALKLALALSPDLVLMDIQLRAGGDGVKTAQAIRAHRDIPVVFLSAYADEATVRRTAAADALGYIVKPFTREQVHAAVSTALAAHGRISSPREVPGREAAEAAGTAGISHAGASFFDLVGRSAAIRAVFAQVTQVALLDWTVLIGGDTGTGKELVARAIHRGSGRSRGPFVAVNCAALADSMLARELFGHRRGAFTGAVADEPGVFEAASGGTLFLDEIGEISDNAQKTLLRVLEDKTVTRLGDTTPRKIDVRLVAATQRDLARDVESGRFRADLYFRLRIARIQLPPLRDRDGDVALLAEWFLSRSAAAAGKSARAFSPEAMACLVAYAWPGNIRELKSTVESAVLSSRGGVIEYSDLPAELRSEPILASMGSERERILAALNRADGNRTHAAKLLGIGRATLYRRLAELGLEEDVS